MRNIDVNNIWCGIYCRLLMSSHYKIICILKICLKFFLLWSVRLDRKRGLTYYLALCASGICSSSGGCGYHHYPNSNIYNVIMLLLRVNRINSFITWCFIYIFSYILLFSCIYFIIILIIIISNKFYLIISSQIIKNNVVWKICFIFFPLHNLVIIHKRKFHK